MGTRAKPAELQQGQPVQENLNPAVENPVPKEQQEQSGAENAKQENVGQAQAGEVATPTYDETMEEVGNRLSSQLVGFDPTIIIAIISAIIQLLGSKRSQERSPKAVQDCCTKNSFAARVRLNLYLQRQGVPPRYRAQAVDAALRVGREAKFEEVVSFCNCCDPLYEEPGL